MKEKILFIIVSIPAVAILLLGLLLGCVSVDTGIRDFCIDVRSRDILTMSGDGENKIHKEYYLYIGRDKHEQSNRYVQLVSNTERELLIHPVPAVAMQYEAPERWYLRHLYTLNKRPFGDPLLTESIWASISPLAKHIMKAFDPGDLDLVLIFIDTYPESISVFYHVKHSENREFYEKKAELLRAYFSEHDYRRDILLEEIIGKQHLRPKKRQFSTRIPVKYAPKEDRCLQKRTRRRLYLLLCSWPSTSRGNQKKPGLSRLGIH